MGLATIEEALEDYRQGKFVIIVDDEDRENEGDLAIAAEFATPEAINFMARQACGLICVSMTGERLDELGLPMMVPPENNESGFGTPFTVSVEAREGVSTGISAFDRSHTIQTLISAEATADDIVQPGHIFPLRANPNGVLGRVGQTEGSIDMSRLAGLYPAAVICEIMNEDGTMARMPDLEIYAAKHDLKIISVEQLIQYRTEKERIVERGAEAAMPTRHGDFRIIGYSDLRNGKEHIALVADQYDGIPLVRMHSECLTGDGFGSLRCDCGPQLEMSQTLIAEQGGVLLYLRQEGRGIGLLNKLKAYALQDEGLDTVDANLHLGFGADERDYSVAAQMLKDLDIRQVRLLTNNPEKIRGLEAHGITVVEREALMVRPNPRNKQYLTTKRDRMQHMLPHLNGVAQQ